VIFYHHSETNFCRLSAVKVGLLSVPSSSELTQLGSRNNH